MYFSEGGSQRDRRQLLVVCTANVCRSPRVAALIKRRLAELGLDELIHVESAGVHARAGAAIDPVVLEILRAMSIQPAEHRATPVVEAALVSADLVLVMEEAHRQALFYRLPAALPKIFMLSEMAGRYEDVRDPFGQDMQTYQATLDHVTELLEIGWPVIIQKLKSTKKAGS